MANPEFERLRRAHQLEKICTNYIDTAKESQDRRWDMLHKLAELAGDQFGGMRQDMVEARLSSDDGPPLWLSCIIGLGISLIPISSLTGMFVSGLTGATQKLLTASDRKLLEAASRALRPPSWVTGKPFPHLEAPFVAGKKGSWLFLHEEIKLTEDMVAQFAKRWEPDLAGTIRSAAQQLGKLAGSGKHLFNQTGDNKFAQDPDVPVVSVKSSLYGWIDMQKRAESAARTRLKTRISDLVDIATAENPAKEAKVKEDKREPRVPLRKPEEKLPTSHKEAFDELTKLSDDLEPIIAPLPQQLSIEDLREIRLMIEMIMWTMTYDFTPHVTREISVSFGATNVWHTPPFPQSTWNRLTKRYIDPDAGHSYADVGVLNRLGTLDAPFLAGSFGPELRLSHYFSQILHPKIADENFNIVQKFSHLSF